MITPYFPVPRITLFLPLPLAPELFLALRFFSLSKVEILIYGSFGFYLT